MEKNKKSEKRSRLPETCEDHVIDERKVEEAIERMYDQRQEDLFNSEDWNWSGLR